jgi:hypothetical protein
MESGELTGTGVAHVNLLGVGDNLEDLPERKGRGVYSPRLSQPQKNRGPGVGEATRSAPDADSPTREPRRRTFIG